MSIVSTMTLMNKGPYTFCSEATLESFMKNGGRRLIAKCIRENGRGLDFASMMQDCTITTAHALNLYDKKRVDVKPETYIWAACVNTINMAYRRANAKKAKVAAETVPVANVGFHMENHVIDHIDRDTRDDLLHKVIDDPATRLTDRERIVISMTMGGYNQKEIGKVIGSCQSEVSKIYTASLPKLKTALAAVGVTEV